MIKLNESERIILLRRRHFFVLIVEVFFIVLFLFGLLSLILYLNFLNISSFSIGQFLQFESYFGFEGIDLKYLALFFASMLLLILWQSLFILIADYYLDCWIITNERTIHTELNGLFNRSYSSVPNKSIQDITVEVKGFFPTFFKYGDLHMQTAGSFQNFSFRQIPLPYEAQDILYGLIKSKNYWDKDKKVDFANKYEQWN